MQALVLIAHNLRSAHNVGSLLRTAEGLGVSKVWLTGYSPYPRRETPAHDSRLPHLAAKIDGQIRKTALGAEKFVEWEYEENVYRVLTDLKKGDYIIAGLEQTPGSTALPDFQVPQRLVLILGREVEGVEPEILKLCDLILEIPMAGRKESFNVVQAAAMAMYHCRFVRQ